MAKSSSVNEYLAALPPDARRILRGMRAAIRAAAPKAVESISYGIPAFKLDGRPLVYFAAWKTHVSLYPIGSAIRRELAGALEGCGFSKGTLRFPLEAPPSAALIKRIVKLRIVEHRKRTPVA